ncbi:GNAT family N-acetyltransferase [Pengzhenrongella sicca]|uniref:GNAT family N-acetyltransferase n=1 Tax=Pengzhenrongella sicca TaxID=2819238 RepID=A0A8A4ZH57_9MICO|nr:GNAT family N-acetyltransferase [Pengzhenrongella sicca]QTE28978.1 GNAT family N-acetyltransferase [Pengzhenrongella sicca]
MSESTTPANPAVPARPANPAPRLERTTWDDPRAVALRSAMDVEIETRYAPRMAGASAEEIAAVDRVLTVDPRDIRATVLASDPDGTPIAHAALRDLDGEWEVKRVVVAADRRGLGLGRALMAELEAIARAGGARRLILQTGDRQPEAVVLYERIGYTPIPIYEPYVTAIPFSLCFEKLLA